MMSDEICIHHEALKDDLRYTKNAVKEANKRMFWCLVVVIVHLILTGGGYLFKFAAPGFAAALGLH